MLEKITRISKSRALDEVHLKLRQPISKHSQRTDLPQDFKKLVLESQNMLWTRRMHMKSDEIWWNWFSVGRFPCREVSGVFHAEKSRYLQYLISAGRKWERTGRYTNTKSDGSWAISKSSINVNNTTFNTRLVITPSTYYNIHAMWFKELQTWTWE